MKVKRTKHAQRVMTFYKFKFDFQPPYNVLIDGTLCAAALQNRISIKEQIEGYIPGAVKLFTTKCVVKELEKIGEPVSAALKVIQQFKITHCPHHPLRAASECISHLARRSKNEGKMKFIIATQDFKLIEELRSRGGIPILTLKQKAVYIENPSEQSVAEKQEDPEIKKVKELKKDILGSEEKVMKKKKKKVKGKNPLSCLKPKKIGTIQKKVDGDKKTRRKKKKKETSTLAEVSADS